MSSTSLKGGHACLQVSLSSSTQHMGENQHLSPLVEKQEVKIVEDVMVYVTIVAGVMLIAQ